MAIIVPLISDIVSGIKGKKVALLSVIVKYIEIIKTKVAKCWL